MSSSAFNHYKYFLSKVYSWTLGDKADLFQKNAAWLMQNGITEGKLLDLGAGFGSHAIPAAELGLAVTAIDFSSELLNELKKYNPEVIFFESKNLSNEDFIAAKKLLTDNGYELYWEKGDTLAIKYPYPKTKKLFNFAKALLRKL